MIRLVHSNSFIYMQIIRALTSFRDLQFRKFSSLRSTFLLVSREPSISSCLATRQCFLTRATCISSRSHVVVSDLCSLIISKTSITSRRVVNKLLPGQVPQHNILYHRRPVPRLPRGKAVLKAIPHRAVRKRGSALNRLAGNHAWHSVLEVLYRDAGVDSLDVFNAAAFDAG